MRIAAPRVENPGGSRDHVAISIDDDGVVRAIADEIARYLERHPEAADSVEGIRRWWITRQRFEESLAATQRALDYLEQQGVVAKKRFGDQSVYHLVRGGRPPS